MFPFSEELRPFSCSTTKIGTFNTIKATLAHVRASKGAYLHVSATLHYNGMFL